MIGPDDIGERRPANHTPTIALGIAAVLLLVVGAKSYRDFLQDSIEKKVREEVRAELEKEFAEKEAWMLQRFGQPAGALAGQMPAPAPGGTGTPSVSAGTFGYGAPASPATGAVPPAGAAGLQAEAGLPAPVDPELARIQESLNQAREQSRLTEQRYNELSANPGAATTATDPSGSAAITAELPDFLREAVENPPGGNPEVEEQIRRMRAQVLAQPSLAKVTSYDKEWGIVTFNAGSVQGVKKDQRFAVRRGSDILGWVKVDEVQEDQAIAVLVTKNADSDTAIKPDVGDDLIDFELF